MTLYKNTIIIHCVPLQRYLDIGLDIYRFSIWISVYLSIIPADKILIDVFLNILYVEYFYKLMPKYNTIMKLVNQSNIHVDIINILLTRKILLATDKANIQNKKSE